MEIIATTSIFCSGKTQIPAKVRKRLNLKDGDMAVWAVIDGNVVLQNSKSGTQAQPFNLQH